MISKNACDLFTPWSSRAECRGEIETKTIHVHVIHPVAQTVHHELERARMKQIERVARPGEIQIDARFFRREAIVGLVINSAKT